MACSSKARACSIGAAVRAVSIKACACNTRSCALGFTVGAGARLANFTLSASAIADALKVKFASLAPAPTVNPKAHDLVLQAHALIETARTAAPIEQARALLEKAIALDPGYADAHAKLAGAWLDLTQYSTLTLKDALPKARAEANQALALDP